MESEKDEKKKVNDINFYINILMHFQNINLILIRSVLRNIQKANRFIDIKRCIKQVTKSCVTLYKKEYGIFADSLKQKPDVTISVHDFALEFSILNTFCTL